VLRHGVEGNSPSILPSPRFSAIPSPALCDASLVATLLHRNGLL
jgi:hypothetical protein